MDIDIFNLNPQNIEETFLRYYLFSAKMTVYN